MLPGTQSVLVMSNHANRMLSQPMTVGGVKQKKKIPPPL